MYLSSYCASVPVSETLVQSQSLTESYLTIPSLSLGKIYSIQ